MTDADLDGQESDHWIAVWKPGLTQLVQELTEERLKNRELQFLFDALKRKHAREEWEQ